MHLVWSLPLLAVAVLIASGRTGPIGAGLCGVAITVAVASTTAPASMEMADVLTASMKGLWLAWFVGAVILGGLFFREVLSSTGVEGEGAEPASAWLNRRRTFAACFLIGPFAEAATGFGVGQVTTIAILLRTGISPLNVVTLGLFSQVLVPWGAMANGTIVGAAFAGITPRELGVESAILSVPLLSAWLVLFWRMAAAAGLENNVRHMLADLAWMAAALLLLIAANQRLGPEIAGMAALGPLVALQFWRDERPDEGRWKSALGVALPYTALIAGLAASRAVPALNAWLAQVAAIQPFTDATTWYPALHPGSWLVAVGLIAACVSGRIGAIAGAARTTWSRGRKAILTIAIYLVMARIMADSGMAGALAAGLGQALGPYAVVSTPWLAGAFGFLAGSGNASNGLLMAAQAGIAAQSGLPLVQVAAIQNTAAAALTMLSPVRVAMGCALARQTDLEHAVYRRAWPLGAAPLLLLSMVAALLVLG
ncbi:L-lactate permease [Arenibaculum sp.]|jgi:lactate permease|uniref:L-lactate permease n=1 Tax=Arenibaculum sp. TaxID=2865862 RepID=UPI002E163368|nr:L-lactate permease [Arenibaculum sp.]